MYSRFVTHRKKEEISNISYLDCNGNVKSLAYKMDEFGALTRTQRVCSIMCFTKMWLLYAALRLHRQTETADRTVRVKRKGL